MNKINFSISDLTNYGERRFIEELEKDNNTSNWSVFHSFNLPNHIKNIEGEIDFIVFAPLIGIFIVEVKGGNVYKSKDGWKIGANDLKMSPLEQVRNNYFSFDKLMDDRNIHLFKTIKSFYCVVCFGTYSGHFQTDDVFIYDKNTKIKYKMSYYDFFIRLSRIGNLRANNRSIPDSIKIKAIIDELYINNANPIENNNSFDFNELSKILETATNEQIKLLDLLKLNKRILCNGSYGTGKSTLAIANAKRLKDEGYKVGIIVHTDLVFLELKERFKDSTHIKIIQSLEYIKETLIKNNIIEDPSKNYNYVEADIKKYYNGLKEIVKNNLDIFTKEEQFDYLIFDECQDYFEEPILLVFDKLLKNGLTNGCWLFLGDFKNQLVFDQDKENFYNDSLKLLNNLFNLDGRYTIFPLINNCRNNPEIIEEINRLNGYYKDDPYLDKTDNNRKNVKYIVYKDEVDQINKIESELDDLINNQSFKNKQITLLTYSNWKGKDDTSNLVYKINKFEVIRRKEKDNKNITHSTFRRFKGLENDVILLLDIKEYFDKEKNNSLIKIKERFINAISRAKLKVIIFVDKNAKDVIEEVFYKGKNNW